MKYTKTHICCLLNSLIIVLLIVGSCTHKSADKQKPHILLVSGWQDINIGDIAHTPGLLHILQTNIPDAKITLWKWSGKNERVENLLRTNFPGIDIVYGKPGKDYAITDKALLEAFNQADVLIHGSGPMVVAEAALEAWRIHTNKPYGVFGITIQNVYPAVKNLLDSASFIFTRETSSVQKVEKAGVACKEVRFVPDATFALNIHNDEPAAIFMKENGLKEGEFMCVIPRLRRTPYWQSSPGQYTLKQIEEVERLNNRWKDIDHAKMREAMVEWVRKTGKKVVVCPEMTYQLAIMHDLLVEPLPDDVKPFVVKHDYWLPDEAASFYAKSCCVVSFECHSPIIALREGVPAIYLRQPEDGIKGQMYYDLGLDKWVFEIEETTGKQIADRVMEIHNDYEAAKEYAADNIERANLLFKDGTDIVTSLIK